MTKQKKGHTDQPINILLVSHYDSFTATANLLSNELVKAGLCVKQAILVVKSGQISNRQIQQSAGMQNIKRITFDTLCSPAFMAKYDGYVLVLDGRYYYRIFRYLCRHEGYRPVIVSLYAGLVLTYPFAGFAARAPSDLVWLNCARDLDLYNQMTRELGISQNGRLFGLASLLGDNSVTKAKKKNRKKMQSICFFEQVIIPQSKDDREYLAKELIKLSLKFEDWQLIVKPRVKPSEQTVHKFKNSLHIEVLLRNQKEKMRTSFPKNLTISYQDATSLLNETDICITISSTVIGQSIMNGIDTVLIKDFGVHDDNGLHYFFGSGLLSSLSDFDPKSVAAPNKQWVDFHLANPNDHLKSLISELSELTNKARLEQLPKINIKNIFASSSRLEDIEKKFGEYQVITGWYQNTFVNIFISPIINLYQKLMAISKR